MRTKEDIEQEIDRAVGKRDQHLTHPQGHPMMVILLQNDIDDLVEELKEVRI